MLRDLLWFLAGVAVTIIVVIYQNREPLISVRCYPAESGDPSKLICAVSNSGRAKTCNVYVSFNYLIPLETKVFASPELGIRIVHVDSPPNPQEHPELAKIKTAFSVYIPTVVPDDDNKVKFTVETINDDNKRTAKQVLRIRKEIKEVLKDFGDRLTKTHPQEAINWKLQDVLNARIKRENFYSPHKFSYEKGRYEIEFLTEAEKLAEAINGDLYSRYKKEFIDIYRGRPEFKAPVIRIKTSEGESTYARFPPYISTRLTSWFPLYDELKQKGAIMLLPAVPKSYD